jgi:hypothetical protein
MTYAPKRSAAAANAAVDAMAALLNGGSVKIYTVGGGVPASVAAAVDGGSVLLGTLPLGATAFTAGGAQGDAGAGTQPATAGVAWSKAITDDSDADATGTAAFFRGVTSGGTAVIQGLCGTSGSDMNLNSLSIVQHAAISISNWGLTEGLG